MAEIVSASIGAVLGGIVLLLWNALGSRFGEDRFWPAYRQLARDLAAGAPPETILRQYGELLKLLALYVGKMTCRVCIAILPVVVCCTVLGPLVFRMELRSAQGVSVYPVQTVDITLADRSLIFQSAGESSADPPQSVPVTVGTLILAFKVDGLASLMDEVEQGAQLKIVTPASEVVVPAWTAPVAVSNSLWTCLGLQLLGLEAHRTPDGPPLLIVRPDGPGGGSPLYPYLSDIELAFWAGLVGSSLLAVVVRKAIRQEGTSR